MLKALIQPVTLFQQNASIIYCSNTNKCAIVDPGGDLEILLEIAKNNNLIPEKILLTHGHIDHAGGCLLYTSPSPRDRQKSRMPSSA